MINTNQDISYDLNEISHFLSVWGAWRVKVIEAGIGYSNISIFGKIYRDGGFLPASTASRYIPVNELAEKIDSLVNELSKFYPECAKSLIIRYTSTNEKLALKKISMSYASYKSNLRLAKMWMAGRMR